MLASLRSKKHNFVFAHVAKIFSDYVMKLHNTLAIPFVPCLICSVLASSSSHLWNGNRLSF